MKINKKIVDILKCKEEVTLKGTGKYIVNHNKRLIAGPYTNINQVIEKSFNVCKRIRKHSNMSLLLLNEETILSDTFYNYNKISINGNIKVVYNTNNSLEDINKCGVYSIKSDKLNTIYIGETITSFHKRWSKHLISPMAQIKELLNQDDLIFTIEYISEPDKNKNLLLESSVINDYKAFSNYIILGGYPSF